jgi:hypothetical protein
MILAAAAALALVGGAGVQSADAEADGQTPAPPPVSIERVREGLERPHLLKLPNPDEMAYFRAAVVERLVIESVLDAMRRDLAARPGRPILSPSAMPESPLLFSTDLLALGRSFLRWRGERNARRTVQDALDEFCATHDCSILESGPPAIEGVLLPRPQPASRTPQ